MFYIPRKKVRISEFKESSILRKEKTKDTKLILNKKETIKRGFQF